jgi:hypothetical protein
MPAAQPPADKHGMPMTTLQADRAAENPVLQSRSGRNVMTILLISAFAGSSFACDSDPTPRPSSSPLPVAAACQQVPSIEYLTTRTWIWMDDPTKPQYYGHMNIEVSWKSANQEGSNRWVVLYFKNDVVSPPLASVEMAWPMNSKCDAAAQEQAGWWTAKVPDQEFDAGGRFWLFVATGVNPNQLVAESKGLEVKVNLGSQVGEVSGSWPPQF